MRQTTDDRVATQHNEKYILNLELHILCLACVRVCADLSHNQLTEFYLWVLQIHSRADSASFRLYWLGFKSGVAEIELSKAVKNVDSEISNQAICDGR